MEGGLKPWLTVLTCLITYVTKQQNHHNSEIFQFPDPILNETYDFIIIGAGSAGSVVANRLSEVKDWRILLVEAGGEEDVLSNIPLLSPTLWHSDKDWNYTTVEQKHVCRSTDGICSYSSGHVLGGGSSINVMNYVRGNKYDYDNWKHQGNDGWGYDDVLPYFKKSENIMVNEFQDSKYHSKDGYLSISGVNKSPIIEDFIKAGQELGYQYGDYNGESQNRVSYLQYTMRNGTRCSSAKAFLNDIKDRPNIHITKRTLALKIKFNSENNRAEGVTLFKNGRTFDVLAEKEVILSSGAIGSAKLLMLSGIGPKEHLNEIGISSIIDLPVGSFLKDHLMVFMSFKINDTSTLTRSKLQDIENILEYAKHKNGPLSSSLADVAGHFSFNKSHDTPDIQLLFSTFSSFTSDEPILKATAAKLRPLSTGNVKLISSNPFESPLIDPKFLENSQDLEDTIKGCMLVLKFMSTQSLSKYNPKIYGNGTLCENKENEEYCKCVAENYSSSMFHPSGTARMGSDGVVSNNLNVWGVENLRIVDNSIMPNITSGNANAPAIMIGEKGSDIIKKLWKKN